MSWVGNIPFGFRLGTIIEGMGEMHAEEGEGVVGGVLEDAFARFDGGVFVHVVAGAVCIVMR